MNKYKTSSGEYVPKSVIDRRISDYENLTLDSVLPYKEAIQCYRVITGACSFGTRDFVTNRLREKKSEYKISEIISLTEGEYGNKSFKEFFNTNINHRNNGRASKETKIKLE